MNCIEYEKFDLMIQPEQDGYKAFVINSPAGEDNERFEMPFSKKELEDFLNYLEEPSQSERSFEDVAKEFGGRLFDALFKDKIYARLCVSLERTRKQGQKLRIVLRLGQVPDLAALPWEYLYNPELRFLSRSPETPVVRYLELPEPRPPLAIEPPLRVLVMTSSPRQYPLLNAKKEWDKLNESFADLRHQGLVELELLEEASASALQHKLWQSTELRQSKYHVFHFIGHGGYDTENQRGYLLMEDEQKGADPVGGERLADLLCGDSSLRLVLLNVCEGARASFTDPFGGIAQSLGRARIPAVIAMQFKIVDEAAIAFATGFYSAVADYWPLDAAVARARNAMGTAEWGTPALYMRSQDGHIFTKKSLEPPPSPPPAASLNSDEISYSLMTKAILAGRLIPFIGADANLCGRIPGDWQGGPYAPSDCELAAHLSAGIQHLRDNFSDLVRVSQYIALESSEYLMSELHTALKGPFLTTSLHDFLATIPGILREKGGLHSYPLIVTTNYDDALECAFKKIGEPYDVVCYMAGGDYSRKFYHEPYQGNRITISKAVKYDEVPLNNRTVILKLQGAVDRNDPRQDSYIITEDNYVDHLTHREFINRVPSNITNMLTDKNNKLLFIGYRLLDWNLRTIFRRIWEEEGPKSESWCLQSGSDPLDVEFWKKRNVKMLRNANLKHFVSEMERRLKA